MSSRVDFSRLADPRLLTAVSALEALTSYDASYASEETSGAPHQTFSKAVLNEYYELCKIHNLMPLSQAGDPEWAQHYLHRYPQFRMAAVANVAAIFSPRTLSAAIASLSTKIEVLEKKIVTLKQSKETYKQRLAEEQAKIGALVLEIDKKSDQIKVLERALRQARVLTSSAPPLALVGHSALPRRVVVLQPPIPLSTEASNAAPAATP